MCQYSNSIQMIIWPPMKEFVVFYVLHTLYYVCLPQALQFN